MVLQLLITLATNEDKLDSEQPTIDQYDDIVEEYSMQFCSNSSTGLSARKFD